MRGDVDHREHDAALLPAERSGVAAERGVHRPLDAVQVGDAQADDRVAHGRDARGHDGAALSLAEADDPAVHDQLDDGAERERLVHAVGVEQRRVAEGDGGDDEVVDDHGAIPSSRPR